MTTNWNDFMHIISFMWVIGSIPSAVLLWAASSIYIKRKTVIFWSIFILIIDIIGIWASNTTIN